MQTNEASSGVDVKILELADMTMFLQRHFLINITETVSEKKLSIPQYTMLGYLSVNDSLNMGKLAALMGHTTPATTGLVDRLAQAGLVERFATPNDRRQVLVRITDKGRTLVDERRAELVQKITEIMELLDPNDRPAWHRIYKKMQESCAGCQMEGAGPSI